MPFVINIEDKKLDFKKKSVREVGNFRYYSQLNNIQKAEYLNWLENGKKDPNIDMGYMIFVYLRQVQYL